MAQDRLKVGDRVRVAGYDNVYTIQSFIGDCAFMLNEHGDVLEFPIMRMTLASPVGGVTDTPDRLKIGDRVRISGYSHTYTIQRFVGACAVVLDAFSNALELPISRMTLAPNAQTKPVDDVTKPRHYVVTLHGREVECREVIRALDLPFALANVLKYLWRAGRKTPDRLTDLRKAAAYLADEIDALACSQS